MNRYKFVEKYKLYSDGNRKAFHTDMDALIEHGFIDCVISGKQARMKSLYKYSDRWKKWGTPEYVITPNHRTTSGNKNAYKESNNMW